MKYILLSSIIYLHFIVCSCNRPSRDSNLISSEIGKDNLQLNAANSAVDSSSTNQYDPDKFISINPASLPFESIIAFKGRMSKMDIPKNGLILDTLYSIETDSTFEINYNSIYGYSAKYFFIYNYLTPERDDINRLIYYDYSKDTIIIPFRFAIDGELTVLTRWRKFDADTMEYLDYFKTPIATKYSRIQINEVLTSPENQIMICRIQGGEGGESWNELLLAQIQKDNRLTFHTLFSIGSELDSDTISTIHYELIKGGIKIYKEMSVFGRKAETTAKQLIDRTFISKFMFSDLN